MSSDLDRRLHALQHDPPRFESRRGEASPPPGLPAGEDRVSSAHRRDHVLRWSLAFVDCATAMFALLVATQVFGDARATAATVAAVPLVLLIHKVAGLYDRDHVVIRRSTLDEVPQLIQLSGLYALAVAILEPYLFDGGVGNVQLLGVWLLAAATLPVGRHMARRIARAFSPEERCLVIGDPEHVARIRQKLAASNAHARIVATLPPAPDRTLGMGAPDTIRRTVERLAVHRIVIAPAAGSASLAEPIRLAKAAGVRVSVLPRMLEAVGSSMEFETLDGMTMLGVRPFGLTRSSRLLKRTFDLCGSLLGLVATAPLLCAIALAIRLDSRGPALFRQPRVGRDGEVFHILKFRTMTVDAEGRKHELAAHNEASDGFFKITEDPRVTRVGRVLRRTSFDELPQLLNVVRGEMSLVGPRPLVQDEDALVTGLDRSRLHLTPGMTGPWQVLGSSRIPMHEMVGMDYLYVANWTLWSDVKILLRTIQHVAGAHNR